MQLVRGPSWIPVRISLWFQLACILAGAAAMSFWCIVIGAAYLVDPEVGPTKIVVMSLVGLVLPFGILATVLAMPIALWARRLPLTLRLALEALPWVAISHWAMSRLPMVYHRAPADMHPGRFDWLWVSITVLAAVMGPVTAEQWVVQRAAAKRNNAATRAKIAEIQAEAAKRTAQLRADIERSAERRRVFEERQQAFHDANDAYQKAREKLDDMRTLTTSSPRWPQFLDIERRFVQVLQAHPATSTDGYRKRAEAIRQFIGETDWQALASDIPNDRSDPLPGDVSRTARH